ALAARPEPVIALLGHEGVVPRWDDRTGEFVPGDLPDGLFAAGHLNGPLPDRLAQDQGVAIGRAAAAAAGEGPKTGAAAGLAAIAAAVADALATAGQRPAPAQPGGRKQFLCVCEDVTVKELAQGAKEGFTSLELMKRYSTVTMGPCQGKMCHGLSARVHASLT